MRRRSSFLIFSIAIYFCWTVIAFAWPLPDTGQSKCFDTYDIILCPQPDEPFYGQDANYKINMPSYTKLDEQGNALSDDATKWSMVRDNVTGLIWEVKQNNDGHPDYSNPNDADNGYRWRDSNPLTNGGDQGSEEYERSAEEYIDNLNNSQFGGFSDWRMPTIQELTTIINFDKVEYPTIALFYFPNTKTERYWTSETHYFYNDKAMYIDFSSGTFQLPAQKSGALFVRAVRAEKARSPYTVENNDETLTDTTTGIMMQKYQQNPLTWESGLDYCENLDDSGYLDWRMPTIRELSYWNDKMFEHTELPTEPIWSSTTWRHWEDNGDLFNAWSLADGPPRITYTGKYHSPYVICVRGGQCEIPGNLSIVKPKQAERWNIGEARNISWYPSNNSGNVRISLSREGGKPGTFEIIDESTENDGNYIWTVTGQSSFNCALRIEPVDEPDKGNTQSLFFICDPEDVWLNIERIYKSTYSFHPFLYGKYNDGIVPIETEFMISDPSIATIKNGILTAHQNGWIEISAMYQGETYLNNLFVYRNFDEIEIEPNNSKSQALEIASDTFYEAYLFDSDTDYYKFSLTTDSLLDIGYLSESYIADSLLEVYDDNGMLVAFGNSQYGESMSLSIGLSAGTYYANVSPNGDIDSNNPYVLTYKIQDKLSPKYPINLNLNPVGESGINNLKDISIFNFTLDETRSIRINFSPTSHSANYQVDLVNSNGIILNSADCLDQMPVSIESVYMPGNYSVRISAIDTVDAKSPFVVRLAIDDRQVELEPNNNIDTSTDFNIDHPIFGRLSDKYDVEFFDFFIAKPRYIELFFSSPESGNDYSISVYKETDSNQIDGIDSQDGSDISLHMGLNVGKYYVKVEPKGTAETIHSYEIALKDSNQKDLEIESNNTLEFANAIQTMEPIRGRIYSAQDKDYYGFYCSDTTMLTTSFIPSTDTGDYIVQVVNENEVILSQQESINGQAITFPVGVFRGNHYIKVLPEEQVDQYNYYQLKIDSDADIQGLKKLVSVVVEASTNQIIINETIRLKAYAGYSDASSEQIMSAEWVSLNEEIAIVDQDGIVTAISPGSTSIISSYGNLSGKVDVIVGAPLKLYDQHYGNLIIVAGGGAEESDRLRASIQYLSDLVYYRFKRRFFNDNDIYYFNPLLGPHDLNGDGFDDDIVDDNSPTVAEFSQKVIGWAAARNTDGPLYIYLLDHGGTEAFKINFGEILYADQFKNTLDAFQDATGRPVVVVIEACKSGTFADNLKSTTYDRAVITSTGDNDTYMELNGGISFTQFFTDYLLAGDSVYEAWLSTKNRLNDEGIPYSTMVPLLVEKEAAGTLTGDIYIGGNFGIGSRCPEISLCSTNDTIPAPGIHSKTLCADVTSENGVKDVWCRVVTPDYVPPETSPDFDTPLVQQDKLTLSRSVAENRYEVTYNDFGQIGFYRFYFYAKSKDDTAACSSPIIIVNVGVQIQKGDINGDGAVNLADGLIALKVASGMVTGKLIPNYTSSDADVDGDGKVGLEEALFALEKAAGMRE